MSPSLVENCYCKLFVKERKRISKAKKNKKYHQQQIILLISHLIVMSKYDLRHYVVYTWTCIRCRNNPPHPPPPSSLHRVEVFMEDQEQSCSTVMLVVFLSIGDEDKVRRGQEDTHWETGPSSAHPRGFSFTLREEEAEAPPVWKGLCITAQGLFNINGMIKR